jgi:predicted permease
VLLLYPRRFRSRSGAELERVACELMADARRSGRVSAIRTWLRLMIDALAGLPLTRFQRERSGDGMLERLLTELRFAFRRLRRSRGYSLAAMSTLAVGLGATTAIVAVVNAVLLQPLPYGDPDDLVIVSASRRGEEISVAYPDLLDWRKRARMLDGVAGFAGTAQNLTSDGPAMRVRGQVTTSNLFDVLRVSPRLGRSFRPEEDLPGSARVVILSHALWETRFGADPGILDRAIVLNGEPYTVVGVMPPGFAFPAGIVYGESQLWLPASVQAGNWDSRQSHPGIIAVARLAQDATTDGARSELEGIAADLATEYPASNAEESVVVVRALDALVGSVRRVLLLLLGAVVFVLLIACANVANLSLVRAAARRRERAVCIALGAGRGRLALSVIAESLILCGAGAAAGLLLARWLLRTGAALMVGLPRLELISIDARVAGFVAAATLLTAIAFGLLPGLSRHKAEADLRNESTGTRITSGRLRGAFVVTQAALAVALLIGAGVLVRSFVRLQSASGGIDHTGVLTFTLRLPDAKYDDDSAVRFYQQLLHQIEALPGVTRAGAISTLPFSGAGSQSDIMPAGGEIGRGLRTDVNAVTTGYFDVMGIALIRGRVFDDRDQAGAPWAVIVDETFAERLWPGQDPIGKRVEGWGFHAGEVIGVVNHVKNYGVMATSREELYVVHGQRPFFSLNVVVRTTEDAATLTGPLREVVRRLDGDLPVDNVRTMESVVDLTTATPRLAATLAAAFAALAMLLAAVGIYGVIAYGVSTRTQEIGTRVALGASPMRVLGMVVKQALVLSALGVAIGWVGALALARLLEGMVFSVNAHDATSFLALPPVLLLVAALAGLIPGIRATRISALEAMRE